MLCLSTNTLTSSEWRSLRLLGNDFNIMVSEREICKCQTLYFFFFFLFIESDYSGELETTI